MLGDTAIGIFDLERDKLTRPAQSISAPSIDDLVAPLSTAESAQIERFRDRELNYTMAFRRYGE